VHIVQTLWSMNRSWLTWRLNTIPQNRPLMRILRGRVVIVCLWQDE